MQTKEQQAQETKIERMLRDEFPDRLAGTFVRRDGTSFDYDYRGRDLGTGRFLVVDREGFRPLREHDDGEYTGQIEFRIRSAKDGSWTDSGHVTLYGPEVGFTYDADGDYGEPLVKPANVSWSSGRASAGVELAEQVEMLGFASRLGEEWTRQLTPALEEIGRRRQAEYRAHRERVRAEAKREEALAAKLAEITDPAMGRDVRVTVERRTKPLVGRASWDGRKLTIERPPSAAQVRRGILEPRRETVFVGGDLLKLELAGDKGRYMTVYEKGQED